MGDELGVVIANYSDIVLIIDAKFLNGGGETGIRTLGGLAPTTVFETAPFDRSGTSPRGSGGRLMGGAEQRKREIEESLLCRGFLERGPRAPYMGGAKDGGRGCKNPLFSG